MTTATQSRPTTQETIDRIATAVVARHGEWNEERCWFLLRETFPHAADGTLQWFADRVEHKLTFGN